MKIRNLVLVSGLAALAACEESKVATVEYNFDKYGAKQVKLKFGCEEMRNTVEVYEGSGISRDILFFYNLKTKEIEMSKRFLANGAIYANPETAKVVAEITNACVDKLNAEKK